MRRQHDDTCWYVIVHDIPRDQFRKTALFLVSVGRLQVPSNTQENLHTTVATPLPVLEEFSKLTLPGAGGVQMPIHAPTIERS